MHEHKDSCVTITGTDADIALFPPSVTSIIVVLDKETTVAQHGQPEI